MHTALESMCPSSVAILELGCWNSLRFVGHGQFKTFNCPKMSFIEMNSNIPAYNQIKYGVANARKNVTIFRGVRIILSNPSILRMVYCRHKNFHTKRVFDKFNRFCRRRMRKKSKVTTSHWSSLTSTTNSS